MRRLVLAAWMSAAAPAAFAQPFDGTVFMSPDVLNAADPSGLRSITYDGRGERRMFDRRVDDWVTVDAYLFTARLAGGDVEFQVNPEFGSQTAARAEVDVFAPALGRLPAVMLSRIDSAWVHAGDALFGAAVGGSSILIHTDYGRGMDRDGYLEEVLFHEAAHVSLDPEHADAPGWRTAQRTDGGFVSAYARDNPDREDVAESILPYFAVGSGPSVWSPASVRPLRKRSRRGSSTSMHSASTGTPTCRRSPRSPRRRSRSSPRSSSPSAGGADDRAPGRPSSPSLESRA